LLDRPCDLPHLVAVVALPLRVVGRLGAALVATVGADVHAGREPDRVVAGERDARVAGRAGALRSAVLALTLPAPHIPAGRPVLRRLRAVLGAHAAPPASA